jgi:hypothetical protein
MNVLFKKGNVTDVSFVKSFGVSVLAPFCVILLLF